MSKNNRREFLRSSAPLVVAPLLLPTLSNRVLANAFETKSLASIVPDDIPEQNGWRYCDKCVELFYNGFEGYGRCPAGGGHEPEGYDFILPHGGNLQDTPMAQTQWRYCDKCFAMFYDGYPDKGRCSAGGGHHPQGYLFRLPHETNPGPDKQTNWRYCEKCHVMFYDGYANKGKCAAGGGHVAQGYKFVLVHGPRPDIHLRSDVSSDLPIGGWIDVTANQNGDYVFSGHMHNSGFPNIKYTLGVVLCTPEHQGFGFAVTNHSVDGTQTLVNRKRDDDWKQGTNDPRIKQNWKQLSEATLNWRLVASDKITAGLGQFLEDIAKTGFDALNKTLNANQGVQMATKVGKAYLTLITSF